MATRNTSKKVQADREAWETRVAEEGFEVGDTVMVVRHAEDARGYIVKRWEEHATILEIRAFDALVVFADGERASSGLGIRHPKMSAEIPDADGDPIVLHFEVLTGRTMAAVRVQNIDGDYMTAFVDLQTLRNEVADLGQ
jgi:hypothetical protein